MPHPLLCLICLILTLESRGRNTSRSLASPLELWNSKAVGEEPPLSPLLHTLYNLRSCVDSLLLGGEGKSCPSLLSSPRSAQGRQGKKENSSFSRTLNCKNEGMNQTVFTDTYFHLLTYFLVSGLAPYPERLPSTSQYGSSRLPLPQQRQGIAAQEGHDRSSRS